MINTAIALDMMIAAIKITAKIQETIAKAQSEKRDVSEAELSLLKTRNDELEQKILNS